MKLEQGLKDGSWEQGVEAKVGWFVAICLWTWTWGLELVMVPAGEPLVSQLRMLERDFILAFLGFFVFCSN